VFGMPKEAMKLGAAEGQMPLGHIAQAIVSWGADSPAAASSSLAKGR
jgi:chemotaxis response regulator CheB